MHERSALGNDLGRQRRGTRHCLRLTPRPSSSKIRRLQRPEEQEPEKILAPAVPASETEESEPSPCPSGPKAAWQNQCSDRGGRQRNHKVCRDEQRVLRREAERGRQSRCKQKRA